MATRYALASTVPDHAYLPPQPGSAVPHVGTYRRVLPVDLERMFENALDWEHLPHLHASSFGSLTLCEAGAWGWRARVTNAAGAESEIELRLDRRQRRWVTRNISGPNVGAEIWTYCIERGVREIEIFIDFFVPGVPEEAREKVGRAYARAYEVLYDEDVDMMVQRHRALDERVEGISRQTTEVCLGEAAKLDLPSTVRFAGRALIVDCVDGEYVVYPARCPHMLAPLDGVALEGFELRCPWHSYRFDVRTGKCLTGQACQLKAPVRVENRDNAVFLVLN